MHESWIVVWTSNTHRGCADRALVLQSLGIPHEIVNDEHGCALVVPADHAVQAHDELDQYARENVAPPRPPPRPQIVYQDGIPGAIAYLLVIALVAWLAARGAFGFDWLAAGRVDGELIRQGEWWRTVTALTLHSGIRHLLGNAGFGLLFGILAGRLVGSGVAWAAILVASGFANAANTILLESTHRSIGASTAVFAALGLIAGYVWRAKLFVQDRWPYRVAPIVGGFALLAFTGTGDETTDIGAHLTGFLAGFAAGIVLTRLAATITDHRLQWAAGVSAITLLAGAWLIALPI